MTWLITGGSGQLGISLSEQLNKLGIQFSAPSSSDLDITDAADVQGLITALNPAVIVNCAAWTDVDKAETKESEAFSVNAQGAENVAVSARSCGAKLIHISTDYVFSGDTESPWAIRDERSPISAYGRTKLAGEEKVMNAYSEGTLLLRTSWLYSPWKKNFMKTVLRLASESSNQIAMVDDQTGQPTSAIDLADRIVEMAMSPIKCGIFHGTNSGEATWFDFAHEIMRINGDDVTRLKRVSSQESRRVAQRPMYSVLDHSNWKDYGLPPLRDWKLALEQTMNTLNLNGDESSIDA
jgi:dTDP-4-dehydrorhamnose reductase